MRLRDLDEATNRLSRELLDAAYEVHTALGPGLLEKPYRVCLAAELRRRGVVVEEEVALPVEYKGARVELGYRLDLWLDRRLVVEVKATKELTSLDEAQLMTYLRLTKAPLGFLFNFHEPHLRNGFRRIVMGR